MNRETKVFTTASGHAIEYYAFLTGKEARQLEDEMLSKMNIEVSEDGSKSTSVKADILNAAQDKAMKLVIVSFDQSKENAFEAVENLPAPEYWEIVKELNAVIEKAINPAFLAKPSTPSNG
jgi:trehalose-6-phosphatase